MTSKRQRRATLPKSEKDRTRDQSLPRAKLTPPSGEGKGGGTSSNN